MMREHRNIPVITTDIGMELSCMRSSMTCTTSCMRCITNYICREFNPYLLYPYAPYQPYPYSALSNISTLLAFQEDINPRPLGRIVREF